MGGNFRIRVVENIGEDSLAAFGEPGTVHNVCDGTFIDNELFKWPCLEGKFENINQINKHFSRRLKSYFDTKFELVEEE